MRVSLCLSRHDSAPGMKNGVRMENALTCKHDHRQTRGRVSAFDTKEEFKCLFHSEQKMIRTIQYVQKMCLAI